MNFFNTLSSRLVSRGVNTNTLDYINQSNVSLTLDISGTLVTDYNDISYGSTAYGLRNAGFLIVRDSNGDYLQASDMVRSPFQGFSVYMKYKIRDVMNPNVFNLYGAPNPKVSLYTSHNTIQQGTSLQITVFQTGYVNLPYTISGVTSADLSGASLSGSLSDIYTVLSYDIQPGIQTGTMVFAAGDSSLNMAIVNPSIVGFNAHDLSMAYSQYLYLPYLTDSGIGGSTVTYSVTAPDNTTANIYDDFVNIDQSGSYTIVATKSGDGTYQDASATCHVSLTTSATDVAHLTSMPYFSVSRVHEDDTHRYFLANLWPSFEGWDTDDYSQYNFPQTPIPRGFFENLVSLKLPKTPSYPQDLSTCQYFGSEFGDSTEISYNTLDDLPAQFYVTAILGRLTTPNVHWSDTNIPSEMVILDPLPAACGGKFLDIPGSNTVDEQNGQNDILTATACGPTWDTKYVTPTGPPGNKYDSFSESEVSGTFYRPGYYFRYYLNGIQNDTWTQLQMDPYGGHIQPDHNVSGDLYGDWHAHTGNQIFGAIDYSNCVIGYGVDGTPIMGGGSTVYDSNGVVLGIATPSWRRRVYPGEYDTAHSQDGNGFYIYDYIQDSTVSGSNLDEFNGGYARLDGVNTYAYFITQTYPIWPRNIRGAVNSIKHEKFEKWNFMETKSPPTSALNFGGVAWVSKDGNYAVVGSSESTTTQSAIMVAYEYTGSAWIQKGSTIYDDDLTDANFYSNVRISDDGNAIAFGRRLNSEIGAGYVKVWYWDTSLPTPDWTQKGSNIYQDRERFAQTIAIDATGDTISIGETQDRYLWVYDWNGSTWVLRNNTYVRSSSNTCYGEQHALSSDGLRIIGAKGTSDETRVFDWDPITSTWSDVGGDISVGSNTTSMAIYIGENKNYVTTVGATSATLPTNQYARVWYYNGSGWSQVGANVAIAVLYSTGGPLLNTFPLFLNTDATKACYQNTEYKYNSSSGTWDVLKTFPFPAIGYSQNSKTALVLDYSSVSGGVGNNSTDYKVGFYKYY